MFRQGDKIVCINDKQRHPEHPLGSLKKGDIYTVSRLEHVGVWLCEITAPATGHYYKDRFEKVIDNWVEELLNEICSQVNEKELVR